MSHYHYDNPTSQMPIEVSLSIPSESNNDIERIAEYMEEMLKKSMSFKEKTHVNPHYVYTKASGRLKDSLLNQNNIYQRKNKRVPPKKNNVNTLINKKKATFNQKPQPESVVRTKESCGKEESVKIHEYNDYLPMAISVKDFKELYTPKTIAYMWTANNLEYETAVTLKRNLNDYLALTNVQRAEYMASITNVRHVTENDLKNDACDPQLLGHRGVFAEKDIPEMSIIGVYTGIFITDALEMMTLCEKMPLKYFQDYLFRIPLKDKFPKITGYQYGNRLSLVNAASNYAGNDEAIFEQLRKRGNLMLVVCKTNECPIPKIANNENCPDVLFFIAGRTIPKGTQLLYDYGNVYW